MSARYHYRFSAESRKRPTRFILAFCIGLTVILLAIGGLVFGTMDKQAPVSSSTSSSNKAIQAANNQVFKSKYFQFQADSSWSEIKNETSENRYVYRSMRGPLIEYDLTIYVNAEPQEFYATRVQPIKVIDNTSTQPNGPISEHCSSVLPKGAPKFPTVLTMAGVTFTCAPDSAFFSVIISDTNGSPSFKMLRSDGSAVQYAIVYRDLTAMPEGRKLDQIVKTFQSR